MLQNKISLVGAGNIGGTLAILLGMKHLGEITVLDISENIAKGKGLDIAQSGVIEGFDSKYICGSDYSMLMDSDVVIVTAGVPRKPGMSRDDLLDINSKVITKVAHSIRDYCPNAFVIMITNPLDAMVWLMQRESKLPVSHVVGMAGVLDSTRFRYFLSLSLGVSISDIHTIVMGGHGDTMVPLIRYTSVSGVPLSDIIDMGLISSDDINNIIDKTRYGGAEIVKLLKTGSAFYAPASSAIEMADSYLNNKKRLLPCSAYLSGEYGVKDIYVGVPVIIGSGGVEKIIELNLDKSERDMFKKSVNSVLDLLGIIKKL